MPLLRQPVGCREIITAPGGRSGTPPLTEYMVTVTIESYVLVRAADPEAAGRRAVREMEPRHGVGRVSVAEVEVVE
jgi:hypothetical protein